ncbi:MAG: hypothetical protein ABIR92_07010, partial [Gemmatimonadaceae bacterium]
NAAWGAHERVVVPYDPTFSRHDHGGPLLYYGASLAAFIRLGQDKGYRFLMTEPRGVNAYFVRNDVALPDDATRAGVRPPDEHEPRLLKHVREHELPLVHLD